jgi:DNA repair exonuclease SbcCD ATPase subunit
MSLKLKELTVKNFMSVGNQTQAVNFAQENLTLVLGENLDQGGDDNGSRNGTGKTTIVNALSYALFGNALTNIKKDNLINKINNKNLLVTLALFFWRKQQTLILALMRCHFHIKEPLLELQ